MKKGGMAWGIGAIPLLILFFFSSFARAEFQFPLKSLSPETTLKGSYRLRIGAGYSEGGRLLFQTRDRNRKVLSFPSLQFSLGASSNVEFLLEYPLLLVKQKGESSKYGSGDLMITTLYQLPFQISVFHPVGIKFTVKVPNADDTKGFGTDRTDLFLGGVFSSHFGKMKVLINADFAILGDPSTAENNQDDAFAYKIGAIYPFTRNISGALELTGTEFSTAENNRRTVRGGFAFLWKRITIDLGGALGLTDSSEDFQLLTGVSLSFGKETDHCNRR